MTTRPTRTRLALSGVVFALIIAACNQAAPAGSGAAPAGPKLTIAMITHETPGDTYWDIIRAGAKAAEAHLGATLKYSRSFSTPRLR